VEKMKRRDFLRLSAMSAAGAALVACQPQTVVVKETVEVEKVVKETVEVEKVVKETVEVEKVVKETIQVEKEVTKVVEVTGASERQSPVLQEMVKAGTLPSLEERLPIEPQVITQAWNEMPSDEIDLEVGQYGGTLRTVHPSPGWDPDAFIMNNEPLLRSPWLGVDDIRGNILADYRVSSDKKEFTFWIRKGLKWSDGEPVTTEDVRFAIEDVIMNTDLYPVFPAWLRTVGASSGTPMEFDIIDEYTFRIRFDGAYGRFDVQLALTSWRGYTDLLKPKHYLQQFHPKYTPLSELEPLIQEAGLEKGEWWGVFNQKDITNWELTRPDQIGFPVLYPWRMIESTETATTLERNPYYYKVDIEGNQLPYIDEYWLQLVADVEVSNLKVLAGEVDFLREDTALKNLPLYKENEQKGGFRVVLLKQHVDPTCMYLNFNYDDPTWRAVFGDVRFRRALALGINYTEVIDAVYSGLGEPPFMTPSDYDPDEANALLDEMGMSSRDADGFRLAPDGSPFQIPFEVAMHAPDIVPVTEMVVEYWNDLGVKTSMKTIEGGLLGQRQNANEVQAMCIWDVEPMWRTGGWTDYKPSTQWCPLWTEWYNTGGEQGEEPPDWVKRTLELSEEMMKVSPATPEDIAIFDELYQIIYDYVPYIPITQRSLYPVIVNVNLGNVPHSGFGIGANLAGEQMFFRA
jgi:peptide/nickel transport system substrate-binding protein